MQDKSKKTAGCNPKMQKKHKVTNKGHQRRGERYQKEFKLVCQKNTN